MVLLRRESIHLEALKSEKAMKTETYGVTAATALAAALCISSGSAHAAPSYSEWSTPEPTVVGGCPIESRNKLFLYTASVSAGTLDIWTYRRRGNHSYSEFSERTRAEAPISLDDAADFCPTPLEANWLMFVSDRDVDGACGGTDIYIARYRPSPPKSIGEPEHLGCAGDGPNTAGTELSPALVKTREGTFLYFSSDVGGDQDIYRSVLLPNGRYSAGEPVAALNTPGDDRQPNLSRDGLTIVFASNRDSGGFDVFMATRESISSPWSEPRNLSWELDFPTKTLGETRPSISWDDRRLYYGAAGTVYLSQRRPGGKK